MNETEAASSNEAAADLRSEEEVAWDKEFQDDKNMSLPEAVADMLKLVVKVPVAILQMPLSIIPEETAQHTRAAVRETFLAFRSLLGAIGDGIESILADPEPTSGPDGTWGTGPKPRTQSASAPASTGPSTGSKSKRITLSDEPDEAQPRPSEGAGAESSSAQDDDADTPETRGLRADIDY